MTIGINTSPLVGQGRHQAHRAAREEPPRRRAGRQRVACGCSTPSAPTQWEVQGRGELQLAVLVEIMRREGFELTVGKPQVVTREIDGKVHEPVERVVDRRARGATSAWSRSCSRCARAAWSRWCNHGTGWVRLEYLVPARGLIGFRTEFLTETRGTGILHHVFDG